MDDIRALVFDVFGTVVDWRSGVARDVRRLLPGVDAEAFADAWRGRYVPSMERVRRGELPWTSLDELHRASLDELLAEFGLPDVSESVRTELVLAWHRLEPWPDSVEGLTRLKARYVIASLSNGNVALLVDMAKHGRLPWDTVLSAELFRHYKPDPEAYLGAAAMLGFEPSEVLMVAAHKDDLRAAQACGLATAFVGRPREKGPKVKVDVKPEPSFDYNARDFVDLARKLAK